MAIQHFPLLKTFLQTPFLLPRGHASRMERLAINFPELPDRTLSCEKEVHIDEKLPFPPKTFWASHITQQ
jgi:hypothetical protein